MPRAMRCPDCGQTDLVAKVSEIYVAGVELKLRRSKKGAPVDSTAAASPPPFWKEMPSQELQALSRQFAPPASGKQSTFKPVNPDLMVAAFSLIAPVFLYGVLTTQKPAFLPALLALAVFFLFYFWKRKGLIAKFDKMIQAQKTSEQRVKRGIERWLKLYYCARDDVVFKPGDGSGTSADQIAGVLMQG